MSAVMTMEACPRISETTLSGTPLVSIAVAAECLRVCSPTPVIPVLVAADLSARSALLSPFREMHKQTGFGAPQDHSGAAQGHEHPCRDHLFRPSRIPPPQNGLQAESRCND